MPSVSTATPTAPGTYSASATQNLVSPPIDLTQKAAPIQLRWAMKYQIESASFDHAWVEIREVGGANPKRLWEFLDATMTTSVGTAAPVRKPNRSRSVSTE